MVQWQKMKLKLQTRTPSIIVPFGNHIILAKFQVPNPPGRQCSSTVKLHAYPFSWIFTIPQDKSNK